MVSAECQWLTSTFWTVSEIGLVSRLSRSSFALWFRWLSCCTRCTVPSPLTSSRLPPLRISASPGSTASYSACFSSIARCASGSPRAPIAASPASARALVASIVLLLRAFATLFSPYVSCQVWAGGPSPALPWLATQRCGSFRCCDSRLVSIGALSSSQTFPQPFFSFPIYQAWLQLSQAPSSPFLPCVFSLAAASFPRFAFIFPLPFASHLRPYRSLTLFCSHLLLMLQVFLFLHSLCTPIFNSFFTPSSVTIYAALHAR